MANQTRSQLSSDSTTLFPDNTNQLISPEDLRDWIANGIDSFVTQKDKSTFENAFYEAKSSDITASATTLLSNASGNFIHIKGVTTITSFGTLPSGTRFILCFEDAANITASSDIIIPGVTSGNTKTAVAGDCCLIVSEGAGVWRIVGYFPGAGAGSGSVQSITATSPLTGGTITVSGSIGIPKADASTDGYLDNADWTTFNNKGNGTITEVAAGTGLSGGGTSGSVTLNLANTSVTPNSYTNANITVDAQGRITAASNGSGGGGGSPGGSDGQLQYRVDASTFGGVPDASWDGTFLALETPKIGTSVGNGHMHMHTINTSAPNGITDYITIYADKSPKQIGARFETDAYTSALQFGATANQTYTFPDATGNVVLDTASQTLSNKTLSTPTIDGIATVGNGASAGEIRLLEPSGSGSNYVAIKSQAMGSNYNLVLPTTAGTSGYVLQTDGSGNLSWINNGGTTILQYIRNFTPASVVGPGVETIVSNVLIPANTFSAGQAFMINSLLSYTTAGTALTIFLKINTSNTLTGASQLYTASVGGSITQSNLSFFMTINQGSPTNTTRFSTLSITQYGSSPAPISLPTDWSVDQYLLVSVGATARTTTFQNASISPI